MNTILAKLEASPSSRPRFVVRLSNAKGRDVIRSETDDPKSALEAFIALTKSPLDAEHGIGSNVTIVDSRSEWDGYWRCEGRGAYSWRFLTAEAAHAVLSARHASDCSQAVALIFQ